jgi:hypothetical protein
LCSSLIRWLDPGARAEFGRLFQRSNQVNGKGASTSIVFRADKKDEFTYICSLPGHLAAGMIGKIVVGGAALQVKALGDPREFLKRLPLFDARTRRPRRALVARPE